MPGLAIKKNNTYNLKSLWGILNTVYAVMKRCLSALFERNERIEVTCMYCGFILDVKKLHEPQKPAEKGYALIADDSKYTRKIIEELAEREKILRKCTVFRKRT